MSFIMSSLHCSFKYLKLIRSDGPNPVAAAEAYIQIKIAAKNAVLSANVLYRIRN